MNDPTEPHKRSAHELDISKSIVPLPPPQQRGISNIHPQNKPGPGPRLHPQAQTPSHTLLPRDTNSGPAQLSGPISTRLESTPLISPPIWPQGHPPNTNCDNSNGLDLTKPSANNRTNQDQATGPSPPENIPQPVKRKRPGPPLEGSSHEKKHRSIDVLLRELDKSVNNIWLAIEEERESGYLFLSAPESPEFVIIKNPRKLSRGDPDTESPFLCTSYTISQDMTTATEDHEKSRLVAIQDRGILRLRKARDSD